MASYVLNDEKMFSDIADGIAIVINSETGIYYGMNAFGTAVFENIVNGVSVEDILAAAQKLLDAPDDLPARLEDFLAILLEKELLKAGEGTGAAVALEEAVARGDAFAMEIKEYNDAQELLLADPIHEVKEDTGWQPGKEALETDAEVVKTKEAKIRS
jgi:hypothetical protein